MISVKVSVILPCYNSEEFLCKCLDSVLNQTFREFELIAVDDGSTDNTNSILKRYRHRDSRITIVEQTNKGIVYALNRALEIASGKYCARIDSDDIAVVDRLQNQFEFLEKNPNVLVLGGQGYIIDEHDNFVCPLTVLTEHQEIDEDLLNTFNSKAMIHPAIMFRTNEIRQLGGYRQDYICAEDLDLLLRASERGRLANLGSVVLYYRKHGNSVSDLRSDLQRRNAMKAANDARLRRGIPIVAYSESVSTANTANNLNRYYATAVTALQHGWRKTAFKYFKKILTEYGLSKNAAKLAARLVYSVCIK